MNGIVPAISVDTGRPRRHFVRYVSGMVEIGDRMGERGLNEPKGIGSSMSYMRPTSAFL